jgi:hypothetical protein
LAQFVGKVIPNNAVGIIGKVGPGLCPDFWEKGGFWYSRCRFLGNDSNMVNLPDDTVRSWRDVFCRWPAEMPRRGVLVAAFGEQIPFSGFSTGEAFLLLERQSPDALGARTVLLPYDEIRGLKVIDVVRPKTLQSFGFAAPAHK